jgi:hypothetical protein
MLRKLDCGAVLDVVAAPDHLYAFVEASTPKLLGEDNVIPLPLRRAREAVELMVDQAHEFVSWPDELGVNRMDVARDFTDVEDVGPMLLALSGVPIGGRLKRDLYRDSALGHAQTLFVRTKAGGCRMYDKHEESRLELARGRVRAETQERRRGLRALGVERWSSVTELDVYRVGRRRFEWAGFDRPVTRFAGAAARLLALPDVTDGQRLQALGALALSELGQWERIGERNRRSRMRALLELAGAFSGVELEQEFRFDYDLGLLAA